MMNFPALSLTAAALALAGAADAQTATPTPATPDTTVVTAPAKKKTQRVCRERQRSGSHLTNIVCKTPEQWAELQENLDTEAELGIPGNRTATGRAINTGTHGGGPPH